MITTPRTPTGRVAVERPAAAVDHYAIAERRRGARALLRKPLLTARADPDDLRVVRAHAAELTRFFAERLGYRLVVDPGLARLYKPGLGRDATRPLLRRSGRPFTPRMYALLALTVAALTRARAQLLVDELVAEVRTAAVDAGLDVDLDAIADRRALHAALTELVRLGVLRERDGDLEHWAADGTMSLLDVDREVLAALVAAPLGGAERPDDLLAVPVVPSAAGGARVAIRRRLVEQPVVSVADLDDDAAEWWRRNRNREREQLEEWLGLEVELRAEGAVALDPQDGMSDLDFPGPGSVRHLALLLLERLLAIGRGRRVDGSPWVEVAASEVSAAADDLLGRWKAAIRKDLRDDSARALVEVRDLLVAMGLVRTIDGHWQLHAAGARFAPRPQLTASASTGERSLFDPDTADDHDDDHESRGSA